MVVAETVVIVGSVEEAALAVVVDVEHTQEVEVERPESPFTYPAPSALKSANGSTAPTASAYWVRSQLILLREAKKQR